MFTGIVEEVGTVMRSGGKGKGGRLFQIACKKVMDDINLGDSLSVNGVCLTIVGRKVGRISVEAVEETIKKTSLGFLRTGDSVNLERAVALNDRLGGHIVQGHVDTVGRVRVIAKLPLSHVFTIGLSRAFMKYIIPVGSIAIDGVSLTVAERLSDSVRVAIIPHTFENTIFKHLRVGNGVNVEIDMIAKLVVGAVEPYIESLVGAAHATKNPV